MQTNSGLPESQQLSEVDKQTCSPVSSDNESFTSICTSDTLVERLEEPDVEVARHLQLPNFDSIFENKLKESLQHFLHTAIDTMKERIDREFQRVMQAMKSLSDKVDLLEKEMNVGIERRQTPVGSPSVSSESKSYSEMASQADNFKIRVEDLASTVITQQRILEKMKESRERRT